MDKHIFGNNLKYYRNSLGITQKQLGILTGVGQGSIANYERGLRFPGEKTLRKVSETLDITLNDLLSVKPLMEMSETGLEYELKTFTDIILNDDLQKAWMYLKSWKSSKQLKVKDIFTEILSPALFETGVLWFRGMLTVSEEHLISGKIRELIIMATSEELRDIRPVQKDRKIWLGVCAPAEEHDITLLMTSQLMMLEGWSSIFLGTGVPLPDLISMIKKHSPDVVNISITIASHLNGLEVFLESLQRIKGKDFKIIIGGSVFPEKDLARFPRIIGKAETLEQDLNLVLNI